MLAGTALDVLEIDAASYRGIEGIREIRDAVKFAPASMRSKVYIIDEAHMLTKEGANAFLKTLEEPPEWAVFILATTEPEKLPVTILSRCQRYAFRRIPVPVIIERLREIASAENMEVDDAALAAIAYRSEGGLRDALTMLEQGAAFADGTRITAESLDAAFGTSARDVAQSLVDALAERDAAGALNAIEAAADAGIDMLVLMRLLVAALRNVLVARVDPALLARDLASDDAAHATQRAESMAQSTLVRALRVLTDAIALARSGGNARLELETAMLRVVLVGDDPTIDALSVRIAALEDRSGGAPPATRPPTLVVPRTSAPPARTRPEPTRPQPTRPELTRPEPTRPEPARQDARHAEPVAQPAPEALPPDPVEEPVPQPREPGGPLTLQRANAAWPSVRAKVESEHMPLKGPLSGARVAGVEDNVVLVQMRSELDASIVRPHAALLEAAASDVLGVSVLVKLRIGVPAAAAAKPQAQPVPPAEPSGDDSEALFNYVNERIPER
jgi:DNA polymerase III subunit gamma/tau